MPLSRKRGDFISPRFRHVCTPSVSPLSWSASCLSLLLYHGFHLFLTSRGTAPCLSPIPYHGFHLFLTSRGTTPCFPPVPYHGFHLFLTFRGLHPAFRRFLTTNSTYFLLLGVLHSVFPSEHRKSRCERSFHSQRLFQICLFHCYFFMISTKSDTT